jgi:L-2-aminoadipate reductase
VKGCIQIGFTPEIINTINMVPVDHVARCITSALLRPSENPGPFVLNITARPPVTYNALLSALPKYGYPVEKCDYVVWRQKLEQHVLEVQDNALFPLLHFVLDDLPTSTKSAELSDVNTVSILMRNGYPGRATVDDSLMGLYLAWLIAAQFLPKPSADGASLPILTNSGQVKAIGRSGG